MAIFNDWCDKKIESDKEMSLWIVSEKAGGRATVDDQLVKTVRSHYDQLSRINNDIADLGFKKAEKILEARLPQTKKARSGDMGEILATEFVEEEFNYQIPIRRLRYKDGRDMALRGDDFIGIRHGEKEGLNLLKGESKSRINLAKGTIEEAREVLDRDNGRCTPISLVFVADRLLDSADGDEQKLGKVLRNELGTSSLDPTRIAHALITVSGNAPLDELRNDLKAADPKRKQNTVNICIPDHADFIEKTFEKVARLDHA